MNISKSKKGNFPITIRNHLHMLIFSLFSYYYYLLILIWIHFDLNDGCRGFHRRCGSTQRPQRTGIRAARTQRWRGSCGVGGVGGVGVPSAELAAVAKPSGVRKRRINNNAGGSAKRNPPATSAPPEKCVSLSINFNSNWIQSKKKLNRPVITVIPVRDLNHQLVHWTQHPSGSMLSSFPQHPLSFPLQIF